MAGPLRTASTSGVMDLRLAIGQLIIMASYINTYYDSATEVPETRTRWEAGEADSELLLVKAGPQGPDSGHVRHWQS